MNREEMIVAVEHIHQEEEYVTTSSNFRFLIVHGVELIICDDSVLHMVKNVIVV